MFLESCRVPDCTCGSGHALVRIWSIFTTDGRPATVRTFTQWLLFDALDFLNSAACLKILSQLQQQDISCYTLVRQECEHDSLTTSSLVGLLKQNIGLIRLQACLGAVFPSHN